MAIPQHKPLALVSAWDSGRKLPLALSEKKPLAGEGKCFVFDKAPRLHPAIGFLALFSNAGRQRTSAALIPKLITQTVFLCAGARGAEHADLYTFRWGMIELGIDDRSIDCVLVVCIISDGPSDPTPHIHSCISE